MRRSRRIAQKRAIEIIRFNYSLPLLADEQEMLDLVIATIGEKAFDYMVDQIELAIKEYQVSD